MGEYTPFLTVEASKVTQHDGSTSQFCCNKMKHLQTNEITQTSFRYDDAILYCCSKVKIDANVLFPNIVSDQSRTRKLACLLKLCPCC